MQFLGLASVAGVLAIAGVSAASTLRGKNTSETTSGGSVISDARPTKTVAKPVAPKVEPVVQQSAAATPAPDTTTPPPAPVAAPVPPVSRAGFVLVEGRTQLTDSIYATRAGDSVVVNFDAYGFRTRRSDKIEQSLRTTLPLIFGRMATASIDTLHEGDFLTERDVIGTLAREGMRVKLDNGAVAHIRILTRVVSDGPIAIGYLTTIER